MPTTRDRLLDLLRSRPGLAQIEVAERLGVSTRTVRRHLTCLVSDRTVKAQADGTATRYALSESALNAYPVPELTDEEAEALAIAARAARTLLAPTPLAAPLDAAAQKLRVASLSGIVSFEADVDERHWSFDGAAGAVTVHTDRDQFRTLLAAIRGGYAIRAAYFTASRRTARMGRRLGPLGLLVRGGAWLVACQDLDRPGHPVKDFSLAGFSDVVAQPDHLLDPPPHFSLDLYARDRFGALDGDPEVVRLLVEPEALPYFHRKMYNETQQIEEEHEDGRAVVSFDVAGLDAVRSWVRSWGPLVRVLEPHTLADQLAADARAVLRLYSGEASDDSRGSP